MENRKDPNDTSSPQVSQGPAEVSTDIHLKVFDLITRGDIPLDEVEAAVNAVKNYEELVKRWAKEPPTPGSNGEVY
jgi:hypothetical protein